MIFRAPGKIVWIVAGLFVVAFALCVWPTPYRYEHAGANLVRIHRITQKAEYLTNWGWNTDPKGRPWPAGHQ